MTLMSASQQRAFGTNWILGKIPWFFCAWELRCRGLRARRRAAGCLFERHERTSLRDNVTMCNLYSITTNQAAIIALFRVLNRYIGNLPPMPGMFPDYPAPVVRNAGAERELVMMRWGMPAPPRAGGYPVTNIRNTTSPHWRG